MNILKCITIYVLMLCTALFAQGFLDDVIYDCGQNSDGLEIGDINNDGENELVVGNRHSTDFSIFKMKEGTWNEMEPYYTHEVNWGMGVVHIADINGDGLNDLVVNHYQDYNTIGYDNKFGICYQNPTTNMLDPETQYNLPSGQSSRAMGVGDVSGDGRPDIVLTNENSGNSLFVFGWSDEKGDIELLGTYSGPGGWTISISVGDVTGDGKNDVVTHGGSIRVYPQNESGGLGSYQSYSGGGESADIGDINNDGLNDVVGNTAFDNGIETWVQTSSGTLKSVGRTYAGGYTEDCEICDVNGDDLLDAVIASRDASELFVFLQESGGLSDEPIRYEGLQRKWLNELAEGDLNGNGFTDIAGSNWGYEGVSGVYEGSVSVWFYDHPTGKLVHSSVKIPKKDYPILIVTNNQIKYTLFKNSNVTITVSDLAGRTQNIRTNEYKTSGEYFIPWTNYQKSSGAYFISLKTEDEKKTQKFMYVK